MTRHERLLAGTLRDVAGEAVSAELFEPLLERLLAAGLIDLRACERRAIRTEVERSIRDGVPHCEAMVRTADRFSCSYEKVRAIFYRKDKT